jgi:acetolactate synthase-1/3 small subunit
VDVSTKVLTIEITGDEGKVNKFILLMNNFGIKDLTRTGMIALPRAEGLDRPIVST